MKTTPDPIDVAIGARLRGVRSAKRVSLERLGEAIGVTYQQIQKYETGKNRVSASMLVKIATFLDVAPAEFFDPRQEVTAELVGGADQRVVRVNAALYDIQYEHRATICTTLEAAVRAYGRAMA